MKAHQCPTPSEIVQWFKFNQRDRHNEETMANFVAELCALAEFCNYGETLNDMFREYIVCGVRDEHIQ